MSQKDCPSLFLSMSMSFTGWTPAQIVGTLTKAEVLGCLPIGWIRSGDARTWMCLDEAVLMLSDEMKSVVYDAACTKAALRKETRKAGKKRKRENLLWTRQSRLRLDEGELLCSRMELQS